MKVQLDRLREYEPEARGAWREPSTSHPVEVQAIGKFAVWPEPDGVTTASMEEYELGAGPLVALALQTGWVGPTEKLASRVPVEPEPAPVLLELVDGVPVPAPTVKWVTTTEPHSSPAATV